MQLTKIVFALFTGVTACMAAAGVGPKDHGGHAVHRRSVFMC